jgi:hypothetical protein
MTETNNLNNSLFKTKKGDLLYKSRSPDINMHRLSNLKIDHDSNNNLIEFRKNNSGRNFFNMQ